MISYYETTVYIAAWLILMSLVFSLGCFLVLYKQGNYPKFFRYLPLQQPSLIVSVVMIVVAYFIFSQVLFFPITLLSERLQLFFMSAAPAFVLFISSGLASLIRNTTQVEYSSWRNRPAFRTIQAYSLSEWSLMRRAVWLPSLLTSVHHSLAWLFSEWILIEAIFNAPGISWKLWSLAKERDYENMLAYAGVLLGVFLLLSMICRGLKSTIGRRMSGYA